MWGVNGREVLSLGALVHDAAGLLAPYAVHVER
jgi:hypothetical protein